MYWDVAIRLRLGMTLDGKVGSVVLLCRMWTYNVDTGAPYDLVYDEFRIPIDDLQNNSRENVIQEWVSRVHAWASYYNNPQQRQHVRAEACLNKPLMHDIRDRYLSTKWISGEWTRGPIPAEGATRRV